MSEDVRFEPEPTSGVGAERIRVLVCTQGFPRFPDDHHAAFVYDHATALVAAGCDVTVSCPAAAGLPARESYPAPREVRGEAVASSTGTGASRPAPSGRGRVRRAGPRAVAVRRFRYAPRRFETLAYSGGMHHRARGAGALLVPLFLLGALVDAVRAARRADVIHAHWWLPSGIVAVVAGRLTGTPVVVQLHGTDVAMAAGPLRIPARIVLRAADAVVAVSTALAEWAADVADVEAVVLPMPLRDAVVPGPGGSPPPPADGPVLAVGRLVPEKGLDVLVRAVAKAGLRLEVAGDGGQEPVLAALAAEVGADVTFLGAVPPAELGPVYRRARLVAVPSRREGFGLVAAEALANGRAVVASEVGGLASVVTDGVNGRLVPAGDVEALADAIATCDPALGAAGPAAVRWIGAERIGSATRDRYLRIVGSRPRR